MKRYAMVLCVIIFMCVFGVCGRVSAGIDWNFQGIHLSTSTNNYDGAAYADCWGHLEQGIEGRYFQYNNSWMSFFTFEEDPSKFSFNANWSFSVIDEENYVPDLDIDMAETINVNAFGVSFYSGSNVRNYTRWVDDPKNPGGWREEITPDIEMSYYFRLEPARIVESRLLVNEWKWNKEDWVEDVLGISFYGSGYFVAETEEEADALGSMFVIPEPATVVLLGLGGLFLTKRKRKFSF